MHSTQSYPIGTLGKKWGEDERNQWSVTNQAGTEEAILQATSTGTGAATLVISSDAASEETVIVTTIISRD